MKMLLHRLTNLSSINFHIRLIPFSSSSRKNSSDNDNSTLRYHQLSQSCFLSSFVGNVSSLRVSIRTLKMSQTSKAALLTLPTEIFHQIFNDLDTSTLIWSVRNVCRRLRVATVSYNQYTMDVTSICISDLRRLLVIIRPENVTTLIFCGYHERTCRQIDGLCSPINIDAFVRLRS